MGKETLTQENVQLDNEKLRALGTTTVFELLAVDADTAVEMPEDSTDPRFTMSVTRTPDGQTVPDEGRN